MNKPRLNLFALPNQTVLLFLTILVILGLPLILSGQSFCAGPIFPIILLLTLWDFLQRPERIRRRYQLDPEPLPADHLLSQSLQELGAGAGIKQLPLPFVARRLLEHPEVFGTWRRRYLAVPAWMLSVENNDDKALSSTVRTILQHELAHFANGDVWLGYFARSFLKMSVFCLLAAWFSLIWTPFLYAEMRRVFPDWTIFAPAPLLDLLPPEMVAFLAAPRAWSPAEVFVYIGMVSIATWPLIIGAGVIVLLEWNRLLQMRELYSDARVVQWNRSVRPLRQSLQTMMGFRARHAERPSESPTLWGRLIARLHSLAVVWSVRRVRWLLPQPSGVERQQALMNPAQVAGPGRRIGLRAGRSVLLLHLLLASTFAPGMRGIGSEVIAAFGFTLLAVGLTPLLIDALPSWSRIINVLAPAVALYLVVFNGVALVFGSVMISLLLAYPALELDFLLNSTFYAIAMVSPGEQVAVDVEFSSYMAQILPGALLIFVVGLPLLLASFVLLDAAVKRQVLTWYGAPILVQRHRLLFWGISGGLALLLWFGVIPLLNLLAFPWIFAGDGSRWFLIGMAWSAAILCLLVGYYFHRRYAYICPDCGARLPDPYHLGKTCSACNGRPLNEWLLADG
jgi:hypothetical protein